MLRTIITVTTFGLASFVSQAWAQNAETFKDLKVGGVRLVSFEDQKNGVRPFNWSPGYTISLVGQLAQPAMAVKAGTLEKAVADNGDNLLPEKSWDRRVSFPRLSKDKKKIVFEVKMLVPKPQVRGLKEVTGSLEYLTSSGTKNVDLGTLTIKKGSKGKALGAEITNVEASKFHKGETEVRLKLLGDRASIKDVQFLGADGTPMETKSSGSYWTPTTVQMNFRFKNVPQSAQVRVVQYDNLKKHKVKFTISNVTLMGRPAK